MDCHSGCFNLISFILAHIKGKEESPVDMDTITLDPEEEVSLSFEELAFHL